MACAPSRFFPLSAVSRLMNGAAFLSVSFLFFTGISFAQTEETTPSPSSLKKLSLEQLMDMDV
ncbi:MAG TPA: hypothetical protein VIJ93_05320, partial [bacterium]